MILDALANPETVVTIGDHAYAISNGPARVVLALTVILVALVVATGVLRRPSALVLSGAVVAALFCGGAGLLVAFMSPGGPRSAATLFQDALLVYAIGASAGVGGFFTSLILGFGPGTSRRAVAAGGAGMLFAIALVITSSSYARTLQDAGEMPFFSVKGRDDLHAGHERDVPIMLAREPRTGRFLFWTTKEDGPQPIDETDAMMWSAPAKIRVHAADPGPFTAKVEARRGVVRLTSTLHFKAYAERPSRLLPLRVGNRWVYRVVTKSDTGHLLYVNTIGGEETVDSLEMEVTGAEERDGFRVFTIGTHGRGHDASARVVGIDGKTLFIDDDGKLGKPAIDAGSDEGPRPLACTVALLGLSGTCQFGGEPEDKLPEPPKPDPKRRAPKKKPDTEPARIPERFALAGPSSFEQSQQSAAGAIGKGLLALVTIGLVILPNGSRTSYALIETHRGPEGAPEAVVP